MALAETLKQKIRATEGLIKELAEGDEAVGWLRSLPGVGEFFSVLIRHEVGEMRRFPNPKKFASYTGLVPSTYASGKRITHGRLTKEGNKWLRWALIEAVSPAIRRSPYLRAYYTWGSRPGAGPRTPGPRLPESWPSWPGRYGQRDAPMRSAERRCRHERMNLRKPLPTPALPSFLLGLRREAPHTRLGSCGSHK